MRAIDADRLIDDLKHDVAMDQDSLDYEELTDSNREKIQFDKDCKQNAIDLLRNAPTIEPESCEDAVSRHAVIDAARKVHDIFEGEYDTRTPYGVILDVQDAVIELPPVTPKRKTGKWNFIGNQMFECSECGTCYTQSQFYQMRVRISDTEFPKFCPNCGADMRGEQDG